MPRTKKIKDTDAELEIQEKKDELTEENKDSELLIEKETESPIIENTAKIEEEEVPNIEENVEEVSNIEKSIDENVSETENNQIIETNETNNAEDKTDTNENDSMTDAFISDDSLEDTEDMEDILQPEDVEKTDDIDSTSDIDTTDDTNDFLDVDLNENEDNNTSKNCDSAAPICIVGVAAMIIGLLIGILIGGSGKPASTKQNETDIPKIEIQYEIQQQQQQEYMTANNESQTETQPIITQRTIDSQNDLFENTNEEEIPLLKEYEIQNSKPEENISQEEPETTYRQMPDYQNDTLSVTEIVRRTTPAIVTIKNSFTRYYPDMTDSPADSEFTQTGVIIGQNNDEILILTTYSNLEYDGIITVKFVNEKITEGVIKGFDADLDLAVIAIRKANLDANTMNTIKRIRVNKYETEVGESVLAIGSKDDYQISSGLISGKTTDLNLIITDANIHNGNTGGPLVNMKGELVGINDARYMDHSMLSMGFAIPISTNYNRIGELMEGNIKKEPGYLGIMCTTVDVQYKYLPRGVMVVEIDSNSACSYADIKEYDIITKIDGMDLETADQLAEYISNKNVGDAVVLTIKRMVDESFVEQQVRVVLQPKGDKTILESIKNEISES